jgi:hypothetical protein
MMKKKKNWRTLGERVYTVYTVGPKKKRQSWRTLHADRDSEIVRSEKSEKKGTAEKKRGGLSTVYLG